MTDEQTYGQPAHTKRQRCDRLPIYVLIHKEDATHQLYRKCGQGANETRPPFEVVKQKVRH